jgi:uncharacterized membrane protein
VNGSAHGGDVSTEQQPLQRRIGIALRESFIAGLIAIAPLGITLTILGFVFDHVDGPLGKLINGAIHDWTSFDVHIPGLGLLATLIIVLVVGWLTRLALFRFALRGVEQLIEQVPLVNSLFKASRQIVSPFKEKDAMPFSEVCLAEYPMKGRFTLGMIARQKVSNDPADDRVVVFFPSNHLHLGYPVILSRKEVTVIDMSIEQAIKFFVSCGVIAEDDMFKVKP